MDRFLHLVVGYGPLVLWHLLVYGLLGVALAYRCLRCWTSSERSASMTAQRDRATVQAMLSGWAILSAVSFGVISTSPLPEVWKGWGMLVDAAAVFYLTTRTKKGREWVIRIENWLREFEA